MSRNLIAGDYVSGKRRVIGTGIAQPVPIGFAPAALEGSILYGSDGELHWSDGTRWRTTGDIKSFFDGLATGVTVTTPATADAALTRQFALPANVGILPAQPDLFTVRGGTPTQFPSQGWMLFPVSSVAPSTLGNLSGYLPLTPALTAWTWEVAFMTDAPLLEVTFLPATNTNLRVLVDGQYATAAAVAPNAYSGTQTVRIDFQGVSKVRRIQFRSRGPSGFQKVVMTTMYSLWAAPKAADVVVAFTGDSFGEGIGISSPFDPDAGLPQQLARLMGWADMRQVAVGATGYLASAGGVRSKIRDQIPRWGFTPDVIVCAAGYNDQGSGFTAAATAAEALLTWQDMRTAAPDALIIVVGPWIGRRTPAVMQPYEDALLTEFATWADSNSIYVPVSRDPSPWTTGTGYVGAETGAGNSDIYVGTDAVHLTNAGHAYHAQRLAAGIRQALAVVP